MEKIKYNIVPIFNDIAQSRWEDFAYIEGACDKDAGYIHDYSWCILGNYANDLKIYKYHFAFAAYHRKQMVGFAKGYLSDVPNETYLDKLYVLPKYQKMGIGKQLLTTVEKASSVVANRISLTSLFSARDFYKNNDYKRDFNGYEKNLAQLSNEIVPVFQWQKIPFAIKSNVEINRHLLQLHEYSPALVYVNENGEIDGIAIKSSFGQNKVWTSKDKNACKGALLKAIQKIK